VGRKTVNNQSSANEFMYVYKLSHGIKTNKTNQMLPKMEKLNGRNFNIMILLNIERIVSLYWELLVK
jgi:hypothetical protein